MEEQDKREELIRVKKDKVLQKHFPILIDHKKVRIVNFYFKASKKGAACSEAIRLLVLVSKLKFELPFRQEIKIEIPQDSHVLAIKGRVVQGSWGPGNCQWVIAVNEVEEEKSQ